MNPATQNITPGFYVTGGTLQRDAPSYVTRRADTDLYEALWQARFCYVLTARQMGKSSLMVRTALRLREEGVVVAVLDLTAVGQNLSAEQWYAGLLNEIGQQLELEDEFFDYWEEHPQFGPLQRWRNAIREVLLARHTGRVVVFIDEIDAIRNLPFSTDEFFAGLREFYNQRAEDPSLQRLTFCLLGVATPSDLIRDTRTTPFNIGQRIELADFTAPEAAPLTEGLNCEARQATQLIKRILHWTGGHPYLTQRLCLALTKANSPQPHTVDELCAELFLSARARELDDNLLFVRERLLRSEADRASLLDLYARVLSRQRVRDDETNPLVSVLRLAGITRSEAGQLKVRNRIYGHVFDRQWIAAHMPDAEMQRQRAAYRRGVWRTASVAAALLLLVAALAVTAIRGRNQAEALRQLAEREKEIAQQERNNAAQQERVAKDANKKLEESLNATQYQRSLAETARAEAEAQDSANQRLLYAAQMNLAQRAWEADNLPRVLELLGQQQPALRSFEWNYLWSLCHNDQLTLRLPDKTQALKLSSDGQTLAAIGPDQAIWLWRIGSWEAGAQRQLKRFKTGDEHLKALALSPTGNQLATANEAGWLALWNLANQSVPVAEHTLQITPTTLVFAPNAKQLAIGGTDGSVYLWEPASKTPPVFLGDHTHPITVLAFSPNGQWLVSGSAGDAASLWQIAGRKKARELSGISEVITAAVFSADNQHLLTGGQDGKTAIWQINSNQAPLVKPQPGAVTALACATAGSAYATGSSDQKIRLWDLQTDNARLVLRGHTAAITELAFARDGQRLITSGQDHAVKLWDLAEPPAPLTGRLAGQSALVALSPDGRWLATANASQTPQLWEAATGKLIGAMTGTGHSETVRAVVFSRDGKWLATGGADNAVSLWNPQAQRLVSRLSQTDSVEALAFAKQQAWLAIGSNDGTVKLWDVARNREITTFKSAETTITSVAFAAYDQYLAAGDEQGNVWLWDIAQRRQISRYKAHPAAVTALAFAPVGDLLATASRDGTARLWNGLTRQTIAIFGESKEPLTTVVFTPDGKRLVTGHADGYVRFWDLATRQEVFNFWEHTGSINALSFAADGKRLATASEDRRWLLFQTTTNTELLVQFQ